MKKNRTPIYIIGLILLVALSAWYILQTQSPKTQETKGENNSNEIPEQTYTQYLVPVSKFTNTKTNYTYDEILESILISTTDQQGKLPVEYSAEFYFVNEITYELESGKIALLKPEDVKPQMKTLIVDGVNFWAKNTDLTEYPFKYETKINTNFDQLEIATVFAGGEIIPARAVDRLALNVNNNYTYLFDFFKDDIKNADLSVALLENSLLGDPTPCTGCMSFRGDDQVAKGLSDVGFDFLSLAGNHAGDAGQEAYGNTINLLNNSNIKTTGTGSNLEVSSNIAVKKIGDKTVGMISADDVAFYYWNKNWTCNMCPFMDSEGNIDEKKLPEKQYGTYTFSKYNDSGVLEVDYDKVKVIQTIKEENHIDYLVVFMSWGIEYTNEATDHQVELAHAIIDNDADLIIASHPHWVQNIEFYKDTPIIYSMGNLIFDQTHTLETRQGMNVLLHYYDGTLKSIELMPHETCGYHQTANNLTEKYLNEEIKIEDVYSIKESDGCVYWQPKKLTEEDKGYQQILERVFEYTNI